MRPTHPAGWIPIDYAHSRARQVFLLAGPIEDFANTVKVTVVADKADAV